MIEPPIRTLYQIQEWDGMACPVAWIPVRDWPGVAHDGSAGDRLSDAQEAIRRHGARGQKYRVVEITWRVASEVTA